MIALLLKALTMSMARFGNAGYERFLYRRAFRSTFLKVNLDSPSGRLQKEKKNGNN